jgi:small nuclear ribonucleoprotein (snRNP)-like protein
MNIVSLGGFKKAMSSLPFDKLFHLYMIISTSKGTFLLEKNERINATKSIPKNVDGTEQIGVLVPTDLSVNVLLENTEKRMGSNFLPYSPSQNNCQDFILNILESNNLITDELRNFVKQNTDEIFKQNP